MELSSYGSSVPFVVSLIVYGISGPGVDSIDFIGMALTGGYLLFPVAIVALYYKDRRRERKRGYTTVFNRFRELPQVDDRTGRVVRLPGEPYLTPEVGDRRFALIREAIAKEERGAVADDGPG